jgi:hypothetical protein
VAQPGGARIDHRRAGRANRRSRSARDHDSELRRKEADHKQQAAHVRDLQQIEVEELHSKNEERLRFLREIQALEVDVTRYLVAQYQHPDRPIQINGNGDRQLHLHEKLDA